MVRKLLLLISSTFLMASCGVNRLELLNDRIEQYNEAMQWSIVQQLRSCMDVKKRNDIMKELLPRVESEKVVEYSISDLTMDDKKNKALARIVYTYYANVDQDVKKRTEQLAWEFSAAKQAWFLVNRSVAR